MKGTFHFHFRMDYHEAYPVCIIHRLSVFDKLSND